MRENRLNIRFPFIDIQFGDASSATLVDAEINAITKKSPISPGENMHPTMAHGHEYKGTGEVLRVELHDHENFDKPAVIINSDSMRQYIEEDVTKLVKRRIPFRMHISYNENITPFLDALEKVNRKTPFDGLRWSIEHAETITPENIARVKQLGGGIALESIANTPATTTGRQRYSIGYDDGRIQSVLIQPLDRHQLDDYREVRIGFRNIGERQPIDPG